MNTDNQTCASLFFFLGRGVPTTFLLHNNHHRPLPDKKRKLDYFICVYATYCCRRGNRYHLHVTHNTYMSPPAMQHADFHTISAPSTHTVVTLHGGCTQQVEALSGPNPTMLGPFVSKVASPRVLPVTTQHLESVTAVHKRHCISCSSWQYARCALPHSGMILF